MKQELDTEKQRKDSSTVITEKGDITTDIIERKMIIRNFWEQVYSRLNNLEEMD